MLLFLLDIIPSNPEQWARNLGGGGTLLVVIYILNKNFKEVLNSNTNLITTIMSTNNQNLFNINKAISEVADVLKEIRSELKEMQEAQTETAKRLETLEKIKINKDERQNL